MNAGLRRTILKANGIVLWLFGAVSFFALDVRGIWLASGAQVAVLCGEPAPGVGFQEAHGLTVMQ
jgi:hypothetical protein